jgi:Raf kinase inhibitor-like YbhB/YbcL family protein
MSRFVPRTLALILLAACDSSDAAIADAAVTDAATDARPVDGPAGPFSLTSSAISEGGRIPTAHSCFGADVSPPLTWTGGPAVPGYALILTDITSAEGFVHSMLWDIPGDISSLPAQIEKVYLPRVPAGAKQPLGYDETTRGYLGPCPGELHRYELALHAVDVYPLPGLDESSTLLDVGAAVQAHAAARATLTATFTPPQTP